MARFFSWLKSKINQSDSQDFLDDKFKVGQIWNYDTRIGEENSTFEILKIEKYDSAGIVIHIYVNGLKIKNPNKQGGYSEYIGHLPFSKDAVLKSVTTIVSEKNKLPDYKEGYETWKEAFDKKEGGVFSITIKDVVKYVDETIFNP
jgi:hypothetical protein